MNSVHEISRVLRATLQSDALFSLVNTRITLRTGIDLLSPELDAKDTPENAQKVLSVLEAIGYTSAALQTVAAKMGPR
ncbi:MAG TPA: hypothetical protein VK013_00280 [Myxococcaceae bacterium]|nr:hypothetical protein [Myxococcaceae bacterium]